VRAQIVEGYIPVWCNTFF